MKKGRQGRAMLGEASGYARLHFLHLSNTTSEKVRGCIWLVSVSRSVLIYLLPQAVFRTTIQNTSMRSRWCKTGQVQRKRNIRFTRTALSSPRECENNTHFFGILWNKNDVISKPRGQKWELKLWYLPAQQLPVLSCAEVRPCARSRDLRGLCGNLLWKLPAERDNHQGQ